ncbi:cytochrome (ubi)quinol oxidase subunit III [Bartonella apis]|uniref:Cytochrome o ubiquinol oxidase subunit 3 n=2 Tax=Bartonella apis TaxID=1686310 RepID=A0A1R0FCL0_9HYPH|nr:cytochrome (ubi)quinol oxidase subunit III [Bartonella apis]MCT6824154.1 cytochrome (ubi)quinol oxidase subunit III [Bartonella apis]OLY44618.1 cytochrome o ubiquinol oxidase subunit 3 [Bartonella apis]OLY46388.1 cytochrome o ubiquinol oxidase subunit 3 [Bartonella apis]OLY48387.1 cytochrome o ubiquinol oxidase subunit 3 [Bartonella apis]
MSATAVTTAQAENHHDGSSTMVFGFWVYILSDLILFATLFATFAVFASAYGGGPAGKDFIELPYVLCETALLLFSSITYGMAMVQVHKGNLGGVKTWLAITFILGLAFIGMELNEFHKLLWGVMENGELKSVFFFDPNAYAGVDPETGVRVFGKEVLSAYWSSFFMLVGTHGIHVTTGLIWMALMFAHLGRHGLDKDNKTRLSCLSIFWHFLDIIWVGVFTAVYLLGAL